MLPQETPVPYTPDPSVDGAGGLLLEPRHPKKAPDKAGLGRHPGRWTMAAQPEAGTLRAGSKEVAHGGAFVEAPDFGTKL